MPEIYPIHDLHIQSFEAITEPNATRWPALFDSNHILRRFGLAEVVRALPGQNSLLRLREIADEVWALIDGHVEFVWHDRRRDSPTFNNWHHLVCDQPTRVLVPFGVAFGCRALNNSATLLRLATHADGVHDNDQEFPWENET
jgi:dTDP-4-dehydrorhamnose 3,5-epimerase-like enzyme